jgi:hypothetical protein
VIVGTVVAAGLVMLGLRRSRRLSVQVHANGLAYRAKGTEESWAWDEVQEFFVLAEEREMHGVPHGLADAVLSWLLETAVKAGHGLSWLTAERAAIPNAAVLARLAEHVVAARDAHDSNEADDRNEAARSLTRRESHREHFGTERADHNPPRDGDRQPIT